MASQADVKPTAAGRRKVFPGSSGGPSEVKQISFKNNAEMVIVNSGSTKKVEIHSNPFVQFVRDKEIMKRKCCKFVLATKPTRPLDDQTEVKCQCGLLRSKHDTEALNYLSTTLDERWAVATHTKTKPTNAFGEIEFSTQKTSKYIRVDYKTNITLVVDMMLKYWNVSKPNLLISVTGGAANFTMSPRLKEVFLNGFINAATSTGAWIITGGTNAGVMKHVGEAVRNYAIKHGARSQVVALGIASWGCLSHTTTLTDKNVPPNGCWPARYHMVEADSNSSGRTVPIDPNHTHFIFVDNGTYYKFGTEIKLRADLESYVSKKGLNLGGNQTVTIPVVSVVVEGGPNTLETVKTAVENGTPVIIIGGSGRAADILTYAYNNSAEEKVQVEDRTGTKHTRVVAIDSDELWDNVRNKIIDTFGGNDEKLVATALSNVKECIKRRDHLSVFDVRAGVQASDMDVTLLRALLKVSNKRIDQLKLALAWNRADIAKDEIFTIDAEFEMPELYDMMYMALTNDRVDFVKLFLDKGVGLRDFLTVPRLLTLYNDRVTEDNCPQLMKKKDKKDEAVSFKHFGNLLKDIIGEFYEPYHSHEPYISARLELYQSLSPTRRQTNGTLARVESTVVSEKFSSWVKAKKQKKNLFMDLEDPAVELFFWSVLVRRKELAVCFWEEGKEGLAAALTAQLILKGLAKKEKDTDVIAELNEHASYYERLAIGVLSECHSSDPRKTSQLVLRNLPTFGDATALQLAVEANNMEFVAHPACQSVLTTIWMGRLLEDNHMLLTMLSILLPPLAGAILKYHEDSDTTSDSQVVVVKKSKRSDSSSSQQSLVAMEKITPSTNHQPIVSKRSSVYKLDSTTELGRQNSSEYVEIPSDRSSSSCQTYFRRMYSFFCAPVVIFAYSSFSYLAFLILYGIVLLTDFRPAVEVKEIIIIVWVTTLFSEELRQLAMETNGTVWLKLYSYISDVWNILDILSFSSYATGLILRFIPVSICPTCFYASRIVFAVNYMLFFFHIFSMFAAHPALGPNLVIIGRMVKDLMYFVLVLLVVISAYGVASQVILYPNSPLNLQLARDVLGNAWWNVYGQLNIDEVSGQSCTNQSATASSKIYDAYTCAANGYDTSECLNKDDLCPAIDWLMPIVMAIYALMTNVLMLNLLIAIFNNTYSNVEANTNLVWKTQNYYLVNEYDSKPVLVPPFIIFSHIYLLIRGLLRCCGRCQQTNLQFGFRMVLSESDKRDLIIWENINALEYLRKTEAKASDVLESVVLHTSARVDIIAQKLEQMAEAHLLPSTSGNVIGASRGDSIAKRIPSLDERLSYLEEQMRRTSRALDFLVLTVAQKARREPPMLPDVDIERDKAKKEKEDEIKQKRDEIIRKLRLQLELHTLCRTLSKYPSPVTDVRRVEVPDELVSFDVPFEEYQPETYSESMSQVDGRTESEADIDILAINPRPSLMFNAVDMVLNVNRRSFIGKYKVVDYVPQNPKGRTGLRGRGVLARWGPNHVGIAIITRWMQKPGTGDRSGTVKKYLECVTISQEDCNDRAFPEMSFQSKNCSTEQVDEMVTNIFKIADQRTEKQLERMQSVASLFYEGYLDDPRNTDNAWLEATVVCYHEEDGKSLNDIEFEKSDYCWSKLSSASSSICASHRAFADSVIAKLYSSTTVKK